MAMAAFAIRFSSLTALLTIVALLISCVTTKDHVTRRPASLEETCGVEAGSTATEASNAKPDIAALPSQVLAQLRAKEDKGSLKDRLANFAQEYDRLGLMVTKSRLYSTGLDSSPDPRVAVVNKALRLIESHRRLTKNVAIKSVWQEHLAALQPATRVLSGDDQIQAKAAALIRQYKTPEARQLLEDLSEKPSAALAMRLSARLDLLRSYRFQGSDDEFLKQLDLNKAWYAKTYFAAPAAARTPEATKAYSAFWQSLIRGYNKKEKFDLAQKEIGELKQFLISEHQSPAGAEWMSGRIAELAGQFQEAKTDYEAALSHLPSDDITQDQVLWQIGWENYRLANFDKSIEMWSQLPTVGPAQVLAKALYWTARVHAKMGRADTATALYRQLLSSYPGTFYFALASRELGLKIEPLVATKNPCELAAGVLGKMKVKYPAADVAAFAALYRNHDLSTAKLFLMDLSVSLGFDSSLLLASSALGDYQPLILNNSKLPLEEQKTLLQEFPDFYYPNPFPKIITAEAQKNNIEAFLPLSLIRQESVFATYAVSSADARGLMQVMPQLGQNYAPKLALENYSTERLFEPEINIAVGVRNLKEAFEVNKKSYILTLASYNAGSEIAHLWARHLSKDALEFIEEIPFNETNGYVKAILRNEIYNRALYGNGEAFDFPESLLNR